MASFVLLTLSFLARALTDSILKKNLLDLPANVFKNIFVGGYVSHILLALIAYLILIFIVYRIDDKSLMLLLAAIIIPSLLLSASYFLSFYGLSFILLGFTSFAYLRNHLKVCSIASCLVFIAFTLLTLAQAQFLFETVSDWFYVSAQITQSLGFILLLITLLNIKLTSKTTSGILVV